jgi:ABC-type amino acid transport system permease subunit
MEQVLWFGWFRVDIITEYGVLFWRGLQMTVLVTLICILQGTTLGLAIGMARLAHSRHAPIKQLCQFALRWPATVTSVSFVVRHCLCKFCSSILPFSLCSSTQAMGYFYRVKLHGI